MRRLHLTPGLLAYFGLATLTSGVCFAQGSFSCQREDTPVSVRSEGMTELMSDIVLKCTGGTSTNAGQAVPAYQILVTSSVPLTSRLSVPGAGDTGVSEALLVVDEPSFAEQIGCATSTSGEACPIVAGTPGSPNVFQGRKTQANTIAFRSVPLNAPGANRTRTLRITNLRGNIVALRTQTPPDGPVQLTVQMFDQN